jgi:ankyrin repeat protein
MRRRITVGLLLLLLLVGLVGVPGWLTYQDFRLHSLDKALESAIQENDAAAAKAALQRGANPNACLQDDSFLNVLRKPFQRQKASNAPCDTMLLLATQGPIVSPVIVKALIEHGAKVNMVGLYNHRPLTDAIDADSAATVQALLVGGADVHAHDGLGRTAIHAACANGSLELVRLLLDNGSALEERSDYSDNRETPLITAVRSDTPTTLALVRLLLSRGAYINAYDPGGSTALGWAAIRNNLPCMKLLLKVGAQPDLGPGGYTPLMDAAYLNSIAAIRLLLAYGAKVNVVAPDGQTALKLAKAQKYQTVITILKQAGAKE